MMIDNSRTYKLDDYMSALASMTKFKITIAVCTTTLVGLYWLEEALILLSRFRH